MVGPSPWSAASRSPPPCCLPAAPRQKPQYGVPEEPSSVVARLAAWLGPLNPILLPAEHRRNGVRQKTPNQTSIDPFIDKDRNSRLSFCCIPAAARIIHNDGSFCPKVELNAVIRVRPTCVRVAKMALAIMAGLLLWPRAGQASCGDYVLVGQPGKQAAFDAKTTAPMDPGMMPGHLPEKRPRALAPIAAAPPNDPCRSLFPSAPPRAINGSGPVARPSWLRTTLLPILATDFSFGPRTDTLRSNALPVFTPSAECGPCAGPPRE